MGLLPQHSIYSMLLSDRDSIVHGVIRRARMQPYLYAPANGNEEKLAMRFESSLWYSTVIPSLFTFALIMTFTRPSNFSGSVELVHAAKSPVHARAALPLNPHAESAFLFGMRPLAVPQPARVTLAVLGSVVAALVGARTVASSAADALIASVPASTESASAFGRLLRSKLANTSA